MAGVAVGNTLKIVLVLGFGLPKVARRDYLCHHLTRPQPGCIDVRNGVFGDALLFRAGVEDC